MEKTATFYSVINTESGDPLRIAFLAILRAHIDRLAVEFGIEVYREGRSDAYQYNWYNVPISRVGEFADRLADFAHPSDWGTVDVPEEEGAVGIEDNDLAFLVSQKGFEVSWV
jgi:hypothetical protein